jgi:hypothetical protein
MSKNLVISTAVLAAAIATAACEKIPSGETNQSGSVRTEAGEQAKRQQTEPQERSDQTPNQATRGETRQASKSAQAVPAGNEQENKSTQAAPGGTEHAKKSTQLARAQTEQEAKSTQATPGGTEQQIQPARQQGAKTGEDRNTETNSVGQPSQETRTTGQSDGGASDSTPAQPNHPQPDQAQLIEQPNRPEQTKQARGNTNLSPDHGSMASGPVILSRDDIRRLQMVLNQKGFNVGKPDGVLGPRTRNVLIAFQRQQGLEVTGKIDQRTIAALGLSDGAGSTTSGQSGAGTP